MKPFEELDVPTRREVCEQMGLAPANGPAAKMLLPAMMAQHANNPAEAVKECNFKWQVYTVRLPASNERWPGKRKNLKIRVRDQRALEKLPRALGVEIEGLAIDGPEKRARKVAV